jgi:argininosuccinate lyase
MGVVWGNRLGGKPEELSVMYSAGRDVKALPMADELLIPFDIWNTEAHDIMLYKQGILNRDEIKVILSALFHIRKIYDEGQFKLDPKKEDVHMNIESYITEHFDQEVGRRIHTGRSRNDQVVCDMKLYLREKALQITDSLIQLVDVLLKLAGEHLETVMPGFTHYQHATISTFGHLLVSYAQALERDLERFEFAYSIINRNPLGAAAGYGTSWSIDRELTTWLLGFDEVQENSVDCVSSRWEAEAELASAISFMMSHLSILCQDIIFMTTSEANMIRLDDKFVGGSSIMPQKRNPAPLEATRAKTAIAHGTMLAIFEIAKASLSGYNRDSQYTKYLIFDLVSECELAPVVIREVVKTMQVNKDVMKKLATVGFLNAVDVADYLTRQFKIPFRQSYHIVADAVKLSDAEGEITLSALNNALKDAGIEISIKIPDFNQLSVPEMNVKLKDHIGGPAPQSVLKAIDNINQKLGKHASWLESTNAKIQNARSEIANIREEIIGSNE